MIPDKTATYKRVSQVFAEMSAACRSCIESVQKLAAESEEPQLQRLYPELVRRFEEIATALSSNAEQFGHEEGDTWIQYVPRFSLHYVDQDIKNRTTISLQETPELIDTICDTISTTLERMSEQTIPVHLKEQLHRAIEQMREKKKKMVLSVNQEMRV